LIFKARVTSRGAMNTSEVLMYASVYSEMKPHPTRCAAGDSRFSAASGIAPSSGGMEPGEQPDHHINHHTW
jgi:hypothetical protein